MKSIAIVNGARLQDGITYGLLPYFDVLKKASYNVKWYQIVDSANVVSPVSEGERLVGVNFFNYELSNGLNRLIFLKIKAKEIREDIVILSDPTLLPLINDPSRVIVKIHDFRPLSKYGDNFLTRLMYLYIKKKLRKINSAIFTTKFVEREAFSFGISPENKFLIPDPVTKCENPSKHIENSLKRIKTGKITVTYIATDRPYKNLDFFLAICQEFSKLEKIRFLLVSNIRGERLAYINNNFSNVSYVTNVNDITEIYDQTDILVYPTLYEGFGRPVIEAMSFGIPIVATDIEPMKENGGGKIILCSSQDIQCWKESILYLLNQDNYFQKSADSLERFQYFSPVMFEQRVYSMINAFKNQ